MRIAITLFADQISPLYDAAGQLWVMDLEQPRSQGQGFALSGLSLGQRAELMRRQGVALLLCGAISHGAKRSLDQFGLRVQPWLSGPVEPILRDLRQATSVPQADPDARLVVVFGDQPGPGAQLMSCRDTLFLLKFSLIQGELKEVCRSKIPRAFGPQQAGHRPPAFQNRAGRGRHGRATAGGHAQYLIPALHELQTPDLLCRHCGPNALARLQAAGFRVWISSQLSLEKSLTEHFNKHTQLLNLNSFLQNSPEPQGRSLRRGRGCRNRR